MYLVFGLNVWFEVFNEIIWWVDIETVTSGDLWIVTWKSYSWCPVHNFKHHIVYEWQFFSCGNHMEGNFGLQRKHSFTDKCSKAMLLLDEVYGLQYYSIGKRSLIYLIQMYLMLFLWSIMNIPFNWSMVGSMKTQVDFGYLIWCGIGVFFSLRSLLDGYMDFASFPYISIYNTSNLDVNCTLIRSYAIEFHTY